jgi:hypothetical protein
MLARALCDGKQKRMQPFLREIWDSRGTPQAGYPPVGALVDRIAELREAGLAPFFLVTAIRHALDGLVQGHLLAPEAIDSWHRIADQYLRRDQFFTAHPSEDGCGPDIENVCDATPLPRVHV